MLGWYLLAVLLLVALGAIVYWLVVITEGLFLGPRVVTWLYDRTAHNYDTIKQFDLEAERFFVIRPLRQALVRHPAPLVLDVATGTGRLPHFLLQEPTFHGRIIGLDASAPMLALAAEKLRPYRWRVTLVQQNVTSLPLGPRTCDAVTCLEALEFFPDDAAALREMVRVLRPGGALLVTRRRGWEARLFLGRYRSREAFATLLTALGLVNVRTQPWQVDYDLVLAEKPASG